jgi:oxepin-CoA hydrolase/3-oxo-5,6-dehydrosuberyl-CoA semialdehyde dehydrogenase
LIHPDFETAKSKFFEAREKYITYFKENPEAIMKNMVFGEMNKYASYLLERKHLNHHFEQFNIL